MKKEKKELLIQYLKYLQGLSNVECNLLDVSDKNFILDNNSLFCNRECKLPIQNRCQYINTHLYGTYQSERWDGKYIYYCPMGLIFISNAVIDSENVLEGAFILGPIVMGEPAEEIPDVPNLSTSQVNCMCEIASSISCFLSIDNGQKLKKSANHKSLLNILYEMDDKAQDISEYKDMLSYEREMRAFILAGDKVSSLELLNKILGKIYFTSYGDLSVIKARVVELIVLLSRAAIDGGADVKQIFWLNTNYIKEVEMFGDIEELSRWLTNVIYRFIGCVFDFNDIKHIDTMYKVLEYVNLHYNEKIGLDDVAEYVFLSKSYLSKIFKDEIGSTFTAYINNMRVEKTKTYLVDDSLSLVDIANLVGFDDQSYFTKVFKKITGVSPGKYREMRGNNK